MKISSGPGTIMKDGKTVKHPEGFNRITGIHLSIPADWDHRSYANGWLFGKGGNYFVRMPCGAIFEFSLIKDVGTELPTETLPCSCGNPKELVVEWT